MIRMSKKQANWHKILLVKMDAYINLISYFKEEQMKLFIKRLKSNKRKENSSTILKSSVNKKDYYREN